MALQTAGWRFDKASFEQGKFRGHVQGYKETLNEVSELMNEYIEFCAEEQNLDANELTRRSEIFSDFQEWAYKEKSVILGE